MTDADKQNYVTRVLTSLDVAANVVLGGNPDETISARSQRAAQRGDLVGKAMVWWLDKLQPNHGVLAEEHDLQRAEKVEETEERALDK